MTRPPDRGRTRRVELDGTIAENIAYGNPHAARDEIKSVSPVAHCGEFVELFEKQYDTIVGERSVRLSGGQRQRVAIARVMLANSRVLISRRGMDELRERARR